MFNVGDVVCLKENPDMWTPTHFGDTLIITKASYTNPRHAEKYVGINGDDGWYESRFELVKAAKPKRVHLSKTPVASSPLYKALCAHKRLMQAITPYKLLVELNKVYRAHVNNKYVQLDLQKDYLADAFFWKDTPQGYAFWFKLDNSTVFFYVNDN